jgi:hypothetical protein
MKTRINRDEYAIRTAFACERMPAEDNSRVMIDSLYHTIQWFHEAGEISPPIFREVRHRLWMKREEIAELMLPERQRERLCQSL